MVEEAAKLKRITNTKERKDAKVIEKELNEFRKLQRWTENASIQDERGRKIKRWQRGMELIMSTNMRKWLPTNEITISELEETVNRKVDELIEKRDELNDRKIKIKENIEAMKTIKEDERITPSFFRRMGTSIKKKRYTY